MGAAIILNFTRGELTPYLHSRIDLDHYKAGLALMLNWVPLRFGGMTRSPGTLFQGPAKNANKSFTFIPFLFNREQTYAIETGEEYFRFWDEDGQVQVTGTPVEVATPYLEADLPFLQYRQLGDIIYIACKGYQPQTLTRNSETSWTLAKYFPDDGPYLNINTTAVTVTPSGTTGSINLTLSNISAVNGGVGWLTTDVGRDVRFLDAGGTWRWLRITARTSATVAVATIMSAALSATTASTNWQLGAWSDTTGWPGAIGLFEDRLVLGGLPNDPISLAGTKNGDTGYNDYGISDPLEADDGFSARLTGGQLNGIQWMADGKDILLGTEGSLRAVGRNDDTQAFGPLNIQQRPETAVPCGYIPGFSIENVLVFLDVYRAKLYEALFSTDANSYVAKELSALNEHLLGFGITSVAYQATPFKILWLTTETGLLLAATYDRDQEIFGVSQCDIGGLVEYALCLPGTDADGDQLWLAVERQINGATVHYVERLSAFFRQGYSVQPYPVYAHCAGVYQGTATNEVTGLGYIAGELVGIWGDGVDLGDVVVGGDGTLNLPEGTAETIVWGKRFSSIAQTLRASDYGSGEPGLGRPQLGGQLLIDVYQTVDLRAGMGALTAADYDVGLDYIRPEDYSEQNPYDTTLLRTGSYPIETDDSWSNAGVCTVEINSMHPATVRSLMTFLEGED